MHANSMRMMRELLGQHASGSVCDVGSFQVQGHATYRRMCRELNLEYTGVDIQPGANVDCVVGEATEDWSVEVGRRFETVISGQCLEHVRMPWIWIRQCRSLLADEGLAIVIAPWKWQMHRWPLDCWRVLPDGMTALLEWGGFEVVDVGHSQNDCYGVGRT